MFRNVVDFMKSLSFQNLQTKSFSLSLGRVENVSCANNIFNKNIIPQNLLLFIQSFKGCLWVANRSPFPNLKKKKLEMPVKSKLVKNYFAIRNLFIISLTIDSIIIIIDAK